MTVRTCTRALRIYSCGEFSQLTQLQNRLAGKSPSNAIKPTIRKKKKYKKTKNKNKTKQAKKDFCSEANDNFPNGTV